MGWQTNVNNKKSEVVSQPSVLSDDIGQSVGQKMCEKLHFRISECLFEFPLISHTLLYEIIAVRTD
jgi:hypothetical protein